MFSLRHMYFTTMPFYANAILCIIIAISTSKIILASAESCSTSVGRTFMLGILQPFDDTRVDSIDINVATNSPGHVTLTAPYLHLHHTYDLKAGITTLTIDKRIIMHGTGKGAKGFLLQSDTDISVRILVRESTSIDGMFLALPITEDRPYSFVTSSYTPWVFYKYEQGYLIVSMFDNNSVTIRANGTESVIQLNKYETYQYRTYENDPSGTFIQASKAVSVFSGSICAFIHLQDTSSCQPLLQQLPPASSWGTSYIVPPLVNKAINVIRIYAKDNAVGVTIKNSTTSRPLFVSAYQFKEIIFHSEPMYIHSDSPVQIVQYGTSANSKSINGDAFMTVVPPISNYLSQYHFKPASLDRLAHYLVISILESKAHGLLLNGLGLPHGTRQTLMTPEGTFLIITLEVGSLEYKLTRNSFDHTTTFGASLYGYGWFEGYGYPLGMKLNSAGDCTHSTNPPLTTAAATATTVPTHGSANIHGSNSTGTICLSCTDMVHIELCDHVTLCNEGEVCYLEKYSIHGGDVRFRSGCTVAPLSDCTVGSRQSKSTSETQICKECCVGSYCNSRGCGEHGLPALSVRGPLCYDCDYVTNVGECNSFTLCNKNEFCSIQKFSWGGIYEHYKMSCGQSTTCGSKRSQPTTRSAPICQSCCHDDFCNTVCNQHGGPAIIG